MAEIDVQPKKRSSGSFWPWLLLALGVIALVFFLTRNNNNDGRATAATSDTTTYQSTSDNAARADWNTITWDDAPRGEFNEIRSDDVEVRGNDQYAIYRLSHDDLFEDNQARLKPEGEQTLREVVQSINTRFSNGEVRIYGDANYNRNNAANQDANNQNRNAQNDANHQQRIEQVRQWLASNGLSNQSISFHSLEERNAGRQDNNLLSMGNDRDRIEIVAMRRQ